MANSDKSLLVFIPCHSDLDLAIVQAQKIRKEYEEHGNRATNLIAKLEIIISINYYEPSKYQLELAALVTDQVLDHSEHFLADANIANGFMVAHQRKVNFLWILSANDQLIDLGFSKMISSLSNDIDLLVTGIHNADNLISINNVIYPPMEGYSFGLISGVIYNCQRLSNFFDIANFFVWTGWSQLSVIQNAINKKNSLKVRTVNTFEVYKQRQTDPKDLSRKYGHSFYGYILLGYIFAKTKKEKKKFVRSYVFRNTFRFLLYRRNSKQCSQVVNPSEYLVWNQDVAEAMIKYVSLPLYYYYRIVSKLPFSFFVKILEIAKEKHEKKT
jgi:hypothetical protein